MGIEANSSMGYVFFGEFAISLPIYDESCFYFIEISELISNSPFLIRI